MVADGALPAVEISGTKVLDGDGKACAERELRGRWVVIGFAPAWQAHEKVAVFVFD